MSKGKEDQQTAIMSYINKYKVELTREQQLRQELEERLYNEKQQKQLIEQRLTEKEFLISRKSEEIEHLEYKVETQQKKIDSLEHIIKDKNKQGLGFFGKIFNGNQIEQVQFQLKEALELIEINELELERLHTDNFTLKKEMEQKDEMNDKKQKEFTQQKEVLQQQVSNLNAQIQSLSGKMSEKEKILSEREKEIEELKIIIQEKEETNRSNKEKLKYVNQLLLGMEKNSQSKTEEQKKVQQEMVIMQEATQFIKDNLQFIISKLELEQENINNQKLGIIIKELRSICESKFGADMDKEKRSKNQELYMKEMLIKNEKQISAEILKGELQTQMKLEIQNGKLVQINSILENQIGLNPQAIEVFERAKEKILKLGKIVFLKIYQIIQLE